MAHSTCCRLQCYADPHRTRTIVPPRSSISPIFCCICIVMSSIALTVCVVTAAHHCLPRIIPCIQYRNLAFGSLLWDHPVLSAVYRRIRRLCDCQCPTRRASVTPSRRVWTRQSATGGGPAPLRETPPADSVWTPHCGGPGRDTLCGTASLRARVPGRVDERCVQSLSWPVPGLTCQPERGNLGRLRVGVMHA